MKALHDRPRNPHVLRHRQEVKARPAQGRNRLVLQLEKTFCRYARSAAEQVANEIENLVMARAPRMNSKVKVPAALFELLGCQHLKFV